MRLAKALNEWRRKATIEKYGEAVLRDVGSSLILPTELLERLVDCAHYGKITNLDQLHKEVNWVVDDVFGLEVIGIITSMCPPPSASTTQTTKTTRGRTFKNVKRSAAPWDKQEGS